MEPSQFDDEQFKMLIPFLSNPSELTKKTSILTVSNNKTDKKH